MRRGLEWLRPEPRFESRRYAAALLLRQLAAAAPSVFNVHVGAFIDGVWPALRDARLPVREAACAALRQTLCIIEARETRYRMQWYYQLYEEAQAGLGRRGAGVPGTPGGAGGAAVRAETQHASLLVFGELLRHTGEFMLARVREVTDSILAFRDARERLLRQAVTALLPRLAAFSPDRFAVSYLPAAMAHLLAASCRPGERAGALLSLGTLAAALDAGGHAPRAALAPYARDVAAALSAALLAPPRRRDAASEALTAAAALARHAGPAWAPHAAALLPALFAPGLSRPLVDALAATAAAFPPLLPAVQQRLLALLAAVLAPRPDGEDADAFLLSGSGGAGGSASGNGTALALSNGHTHGHVHSHGSSGGEGDGGDAGAPSARCALVCLAVHTLGDFDFRGVPLLELARSLVAPHIGGGAEAESRRAAALAAAALLRRRGAPRPHPAAAALAQRLLGAAVADPDATVRAAVLEALLPPSPALDAHLARADTLRALLLALNDEAPACRAAAARLVGRLAPRNAAHALPALRRHMLALLADLERGPDSAARTEAARLLGVLVRACPRLVAPYVPPLLRALTAKLRPAAPAVAGAAGASNGAAGNAAAAAARAAAVAATPASIGGPLGVLGSVDAGPLSLGAPAPVAPAAPVAEASSSAMVLAAAAGGDRLPAPPGAHASAAERCAVLGALGDLAAVAGDAVAPFLSELLPLLHAALGARGGGGGGVREAAVVTLGALAACGAGEAPLAAHPGLLEAMLQALSEAPSAAARREALRTLGALGALDPTTHRERQERLAGEGLLSAEGVRGQSRADGPPTAAGPGPPQGGGNAPAPAAPTAADDAAMTSAAAEGRAGGRGPGADTELIPSAGLTTANEEFYPTIAINALAKVLLDPALSSLHPMALRSLMYLLGALGLGCVPFLPRCMPVLLALARSRAADEALREQLFGHLTQLVGTIRGHARAYAGELLPLVYRAWSGASPALLPALLRLLEALSAALADEFAPHLADVLPRCAAALGECERSRRFEAVPHLLRALEAFQLREDAHVRAVLPVLTRLLKPPDASRDRAAAADLPPSTTAIMLPGAPAAAAGVPVATRRAVLRCMARLLPRAPLGAHASAAVLPLVRVVAGPDEELRRPAADALSALAAALGPDFAVFLPVARRALSAARLQHAGFAAIAAALDARQPWLPPPDATPAIASATTPRADSGAAAPGAADAAPATPDGAAPPAPPPPGGRLPVDEAALRRAWASAQRSTADDWREWQRHLCLEQLRCSASPALRACLELAQAQPHVARDLFPAAFAACWAELGDAGQDALARGIEAALASPRCPPAIVTALLNLAEFMEHDEKPLPLDARALGAIAERCHAYAKALHYKEAEFATAPADCVEALIAINTALGQPEAAAGVLALAQSRLSMDIKEGWFEKLGRWEAALEAYERRAAGAPRGSSERADAQAGRMRCLAALAEWARLAEAAEDEWECADVARRACMAPVAAQAAWHLGQWEALEEYAMPLPSAVADAEATAAAEAAFPRPVSAQLLTLTPPRLAAAAVAAQQPPPLPSAAAAGDLALATDGDFYRALLCVRRGDFPRARAHVDAARELLAAELAALLGESYERAYDGLVRAQQLTELEEVMEYAEAGAEDETSPDGGVALPLGGGAARRGAIRGVWRSRLRGATKSAGVWQALLGVRALVLPLAEEVDTWASFASLQRKAGAQRAAHRTLLAMLRYDPGGAAPGTPGFGAGSGAPTVMLAYLKHLWATGQKADAFSRLTELVSELRASSAAALTAASEAGPDAAPHASPPPAPLVARACLKLGAWRWELAGGALDDAVIGGVLSSLRGATEADRGWSKAWHMWGLFNAAAMEHYARSSPTAAARHVAPAVTGFFRSIALAGAPRDDGGVARGGTHLQDILRLLTLWFAHGAAPDVEAALQEGFAHVSVDTWLAVIPQIVARIHSPSPPVRHLIHTLLVRVGRHHPQALLYPVLVAAKSQSSARRGAAVAVLDALRTHSATLVEQAQLVSGELIRVAILWHEAWHEALEEASRLYFGEANVEGMLAVLAPLHAQLARAGPETLTEGAFVAAYGRELAEAADWCAKYRASGREVELNNAWDLYYHVFKRINKQLPALTSLELAHVSPRLLAARRLELAVPGNYIVGAPVVTISAFSPTLHVITSKQRPRKLSVAGSDGKVYGYLLKGHEDLRQDERVMQLFGLVNMLLAGDARTAARDLSIARYAVVPLSPNSGLLGWVPNCDTLHALIREHRDAHKVPLNLEHRLMLAMAPDYDHLPLMAKVEVFEHALGNTPGDDLARVLWLRSRSSEVWLARRTAYTRSLAVMSMVGYLLGLGDRHPSNLMLDRYSGKILHIDFGDCFEASMNREKFPEKVPFRLTRMLVTAMEAAGIDGTFRATSESVVGVLRSNKDSVMAMLEAFVHDPLINWRLLNAADAGAAPAAAGAAAAAATPPAAAAEPGTSEAGVAAFASTAPVTAFAVAAAAAAAAPPPKVTERRVSSGGLALGPPPMTAVQRRKSSGGLALAGSSVVGALIGSLAGGGGMAAAAAAAEAAAGGAPAAAGVAPAAPSPPQRAARERELKDMLGALGDANEVLNERAVSVMRRMAAKLTGRDGGLPGVTGAGATDGPPDNVEVQVQRLILQATSHENLCQSYIGWCPCAFALRCFACAVVAVLTRAALCAVW